MFHGMGSDVRFVLRTLRRSPGFVLVAVLSLALGIGANASMFGVVRTLLMTPLPVPSPEELALVSWDREGDFRISQMGSTDYADATSGRRYQSNLSYPIYQALSRQAPDGTDLFAFAFLRGVSVAAGDQPAFLAGGTLADGAYFSVLRVPMALGRPLGPADDRPGAPLVAVLGHAFWMRAFGGDPGVVGRTVRVNGQPAEVVGVTGPGFVGLSMGGFFPRTDITVPLSAQPTVYPRMGSGNSLFSSETRFWVRVMGRIRGSEPDEGAWPAAEQALEAALRAQPSPLVGGDEHLPELRLLPGSQGAQPVRPSTARLLFLLVGVVAVVLLIACVNLASLMLARGVSRQREMAVRQALGGSRFRLIRQTLLESAVLSGAGTMIGLCLAFLGRGFLGNLLTESIGSGAFGQLDLRGSLDPAVLVVTSLLGIAATFLFGLLPSLRLSGLRPGAWLKDRAAGAAHPRLRAGRVLIAIQIGVSVPLVVGAVLLLRSASNLASVELGFDPEGLVAFQVDPGFARIPPEENARLYLELLARVSEVPGVRSATLMENALLSGIISNSSFEYEGERHSLHVNAVGPGFLETLGVRLVAGRVPGVQDDDDAPTVGVVNEAAVREVFKGESPVGRILQLRNSEVRVVGVVSDTPYRSLKDPVPPTLYPSALQRDGYGGHHLVLRTDVPTARLEPLVREAVFQVDANLPVPELQEQTALIARTTAKERVFTQLLSLFGGFALLLASIGLHGVTSYAVARRTSEIGVRIAVGARPTQIGWLVLRQVVGLALVGLAIGVPVALWSGPLVASLLFGVEPASPAALAAAAVVMVAVAAGAGLAPALRAARLDALVALRTE